MLFQTVLILFFAFWFFEEYANNAFFQVYVSNFFQGGFLSVIIVIAIVGFTGAALALYWRLRSTHRELQRLLSTQRAGSSGNGRGQVLDNRTEQHLIEMIRKTMPKEGSG